MRILAVSLAHRCPPIDAVGQRQVQARVRVALAEANKPAHLRPKCHLLTVMLLGVVITSGPKAACTAAAKTANDAECWDVILDGGVYALEVVMLPMLGLSDSVLPLTTKPKSLAIGSMTECQVLIISCSAVVWVSSSSGPGRERGRTSGVELNTAVDVGDSGLGQRVDLGGNSQLSSASEATSGITLISPLKMVTALLVWTRYRSALLPLANVSAILDMSDLLFLPHTAFLIQDGVVESPCAARHWRYP